MTQEVIVFPDAAAVVIDWLRPQLAAHGSTVSVSNRVPNPRPLRFVTVQRQGGTSHDLVFDASMLTIECWAGSMSAAMDLAQLARGLVNAMQNSVQSGVAVYRVDEVGGPGELPDPESDQPRATLTMQVQLRGYAA